MRKEVYDRESASNALLQNCISSVIIDETSVISGYEPIDGEIDVLPLMDYFIQQGHIIVLPVVDCNSKILLFHEKNTVNYIVPNVLIVPLIAFDKHLNRLGFGGGYYDNTISTLRPHCKVIGVAYDLQICDLVPVESHDQALDMVITEKAIYRNSNVLSNDFICR